jgi:hypothetical protein
VQQRAEIVEMKVCDPAPQREIRRVRRLGLQSDEVRDDLYDGCGRPLEQ